MPKYLRSVPVSRRRGAFARAPFAAGLAAVLPLIAACRPSSAPPPAPPPPLRVSVVTVEPRTVPINYEFIAQTTASQRVEIRARVQGFLARRAYQEGSKVDEGELLFRIDPRSFEAELEIANAKLAQAQARVELAHRDVERYEEAATRGAATAREVDDAKTQELVAKADVRLAQAEVAARSLDLSYTTVLAPFRGQVGKSFKDEGALVDAGANSLLAEMVQTDPIYVEFNIAEREVLRWKADVDAGRIRVPEGRSREVVITLVDGTEYEHRGVLDFWDIQVRPQTGTALRRATLANPDDKLKPGQFVKARIVGWERVGALAVPQRAVVQNPSGAFVYLADADNKAQLRGVTLGAWTGSEWIVEAGLKPGDRVITDQIAKLRPDAPIEIDAAPAAPAPDREPPPLRGSPGNPAPSTPPATAPPSPPSPGPGAGGTGGPR
jgi:membrane fusion protein (multidrug efflux system)